MITFTSFSSSDWQVWVAGVFPLAIPLLRLVFSASIVLGVGLATSVAGLLFLTVPLLIQQRFDLLLTAGSSLPLRFAWPVLHLPVSFAEVPVGPVLIAKVFFLTLMLGYRRDRRGWWWPAVDGALCLTLSAGDLNTYLAFWTISLGLALAWIASQLDGGTDENSDALLRLAGVVTIGMGLMTYCLLQKRWEGIWFAALVLGAGTSFQASETVGDVGRRLSLAAMVLAAALPGNLIMVRLSNLSGDVPYLIPMLSMATLLGGICSLRSRTMEGMIAGAFICTQSALLLGLYSGLHTHEKAYEPTPFIAFSAPFAVLVALSASMPAFLHPLKRQWIGSLRGRTRRALAALSLGLLAFEMGTLPFGLLGFPFQRLLEHSAVTALAVCLGLLAAASATLSILGGFWFADASLRWPTRDITHLARRYFRV